MDKLSQMQIMEKVFLLEQEEKRRKTINKLASYNKGKKKHLKQLEFHKCLLRNRWVFGGNRSGKTECGAVESVWVARGIHPYRKNKPNISGWVVSLSYEVQRDVAQNKIMFYLNPDWIEDIVMQSGKKCSPEYGIIDYILIKNIFGGLSRIGFKSVDQGREKFQGTSLDFVWFDEEPPKDIYDECRMRVLDRVGNIWGTMTPLKGLTWVYDEIYLNKSANCQVWHIAMEWADNPYLDTNEVKLLDSSLDKDIIDSRRYGKFNVGCGLVYREFDEGMNVIEPFEVPDEWKDEISIDPGLNNPLACLFFAVDYDGNIYVVGEHYEAGKDIDYHTKRIFELAVALNWHYDSKGRLCSLIDSASNQRTLAYSKSVSELFYDKGIVVNAKVNKDVFSGIANVKKYLCAKKLFIFKNCVNLIREFKSYWWGDGDRPKKADDHALDALRYYIMSKPECAISLKTEKSVIEKDKAILIKKLKQIRKS